MKKILFSILTFSVLTLPMLATNPVMTAMPSLTIAPDGRAAGMGDVGVATNVFSRRENISYGKAVYHISLEIYHFYAPKEFFVFRRVFTFLKVYNPL